MLLYSIVNELERKIPNALMRGSDVTYPCIPMFSFFPILSFFVPIFFFFEAYPYTARLFLVVAAPVTFF